MRSFKRLAVLVSVSAAMFGLGAVSQRTIQPQKVNAGANVETLKLGRHYKKDFLTLKVTEYKENRHKNIIVTTYAKKQFYQVGSNDDKQGRTKNGVTIAYGPDQK